MMTLSGPMMRKEGGEKGEVITLLPGERKKEGTSRGMESENFENDLI